MLKKIISGVFGFAMCILTATAHPLDISSTMITLYGDRGSATTYFHPFEVEYLMRESGRTFSDAMDFVRHQDLSIDYLTGQLNFHIADGSSCRIVDPALVHTDISRILTEGLQIDYSIICPQSIDTLDIDVRFFTGFQLQTNKVTLLDSEGNEVFFKVGTPIIHHFTYTRGKQIEIMDMDHDGLSDEEERAYLTDINRADTDDDFYTDTEEVMHGWDPRNPAVSPGQIRRDTPVPVSMRPDSSIAQVANTASSSVPSTTHTLSSGSGIVSQGLSTGVWGESYFSHLMQRIGQLASHDDFDGMGFGYLMALAVLLGFFHALGPGHAKVILGSLMLDSHMSYMRGIRFALVFSVTHIIDILFLFLLIRLIGNWIDMSRILSILQIVSPVLLFTLSSILLVQMVRSHGDSGDTTGEDARGSLLEKSTSSIWIFGIVSGLIPCTFGWSVFFLLFSLGKIAWIPWLIGSIGVGIFLCLVVILTLIYYSRVMIQSRFGVYSRYASLFSMGILWGISIVLMYNILKNII